MSRTGKGGAAALAAAAVLLVAGGVAYATIPDANGVIHACYQTNKGSLRVVESASSCTQAETALQWNQTGPQGPKGDPGPQGPTGPTGPAGPPGPAGSGHVYEVSSAWDGSLPYGSSVFPQAIETMTVPAGDWVVWATGSYGIGMGSPAILDCSIGNAAHGEWTAPSDGIGSYALVGTVSLPNGGTIELDCAGGPDNSDAPAMMDNNLVALQVGGIN